MPTVKADRVVGDDELAAFLHSQSVLGWQVFPAKRGFYVSFDDDEVRVRSATRRGRTTLRVDLVYPWWSWLGLLAGIIGAIATTAAAYAMGKGFLREVQGRLRHQFAGGPAYVRPGHDPAMAASSSSPPQPLASCPYCKALVAPLYDAQGRRVCPVCRNTGVRPRRRSVGVRAAVAAVVVTAVVVVTAAFIFTMVNRLAGPEVVADDTQAIPPYTSMTIDLPMRSTDRREFHYTFTATDGRPVSAGFYRVEEATGAADWTTGVAVTHAAASGQGTATLAGPGWGFVVDCGGSEPCTVHYRVVSKRLSR